MAKRFPQPPNHRAVPIFFETSCLTSNQKMGINGSVARALDRRNGGRPSQSRFPASSAVRRTVGLAADEIFDEAAIPVVGDRRLGRHLETALPIIKQGFTGPYPSRISELVPAALEPAMFLKSKKPLENLLKVEKARRE